MTKGAFSYLEAMLQFPAGSYFYFAGTPDFCCSNTEPATFVVEGPCRVISYSGGPEENPTITIRIDHKTVTHDLFRLVTPEHGMFRHMVDAQRHVFAQQAQLQRTAPDVTSDDDVFDEQVGEADGMDVRSYD